MGFDLGSSEYAVMWEELNKLLREKDLAVFYKVQPYEGGTLSKRQAEVELAMSTYRTKAEGLDVACYSWEDFTPRVVTILSEYYELGGFSRTIPSMFEDHFESWWEASKPDGLFKIMTLMQQEKTVRYLLKSSPLMMIKLQQFLCWYRDNKAALEAVNYGTFYCCEVRSEHLFLDSYLKFLNDTDSLRMAAFSLNSPSWWAFVTKQREAGVNLIFTAQDAEDALATVACIQQRPTRKETITKPVEYTTWGFQNKFLWDLEHDPGFRARMFKQDPELGDKFVELGGVTDDFVDWIRRRE